MQKTQYTRWAPKSPDSLPIRHSLSLAQPTVPLTQGWLFKGWRLPYLHRPISESWHRFLILLPAELI